MILVFVFIMENRPTNSCFCYPLNLSSGSAMNRNYSFFFLDKINTHSFETVVCTHSVATSDPQCVEYLIDLLLLSAYAADGVKKKEIST